MKKKIKGLTATVKTNVVHGPSLMKAEADWRNKDVMQDMLNKQVALLWMCTTDEDAMKVAQDFLWRLIVIFNHTKTKDSALVFVGVADSLFCEYAKQHKLFAEQFGFHYPTHKWVRHAFADQVRVLIAKKDKGIMAGFISRRWGVPVTYLYPEKYLEKGEECVMIPYPTIEILEDEDD